jgi:hypothetical protein
MEVANLRNVTATGDVTTASAYLYSVALSAGSDAATLTIKTGGESGTTIAVLKAAAGVTTVLPLGAAVLCSGGLHATLAGTSPNAALVYT